MYTQDHDPRVPVVKRHPEDTAISFEEVMAILRNPKRRPICPVDILIYHDCVFQRRISTMNFELSREDDNDILICGGGDRESNLLEVIRNNDVLYICWFANFLSFMLIVYR